MRLTREEALDRVIDTYVSAPEGDKISPIANLLLSVQAETARPVLVHVGDSVLTRDLVWCECGRGLSLNGRWEFCPHCGGKIDQASYESAAAVALHRGANRYRDMTDAEENIRLTAELTVAKLDCVETERRVAQKCCEIAEEFVDWDGASIATRAVASGIAEEIRAAFPGEEAK